MKSDKMQYFIYSDVEYLIREINRRENNPEKSSTMKISQHIPCRYFILTVGEFDLLENKHTLYCGKDCMKNVL